MDIPPPTQQDCAQFDFIEGLKVHNYTKCVRSILDDYPSRARAYEQERGYAPRSIEEAGILIEQDPLYCFAASIAHYSQAYMWLAVRDSLTPHEGMLTSQVDELLPLPPQTQGQARARPRLPAAQVVHRDRHPPPARRLRRRPSGRLHLHEGPPHLPHALAQAGLPQGDLPRLRPHGPPPRLQAHPRHGLRRRRQHYDPARGLSPMPRR